MDFRRSSTNRRRAVLLAALMIAGTAGALWGSAPSLLRGPLLALAAPGMEAEVNTMSWFSHLALWFEGKRGLTAKIARLEEIALRYRALETRYRALLEDHQELRASFGRASEERHILAYVVSRPGNTLYDTLLVDAGSADGAVRGAVVFAFEGVAIGTIAEVDSQTALVSLFSSPGRETEVFIGGETATVASAVGRGGGVISVSLPSAVFATEGTPVIIPGASTGSVLVGAVEHITVREADAFQDIFIRLPVNLSRIRRVFIEIP